MSEHLVTTYEIKKTEDSIMNENYKIDDTNKFVEEQTDQCFYMLKIKNNITTVFDNDDGRFSLQENSDRDVFKFCPESFDLIIFIFDKNEDNDYEPLQIKLARCQKMDDRAFYFNIYATTESKLRIENFMNLIDLDLRRDFDARSYFSKEYAVALFEDLKIGLITHKKTNSSVISNNDYREDLNKIITSKAFRRLVDKAQIFTSSKGDHYRTRMTHTLMVSQIARTIAYKLELDEVLTEAIALGHDLGHTPFGHQGEFTLNKILNGSIPLIKNINEPDCKNLIQGFKHNYQALRVLTLLENDNLEYNGMNISPVIMEGIWKHTKIFEKNSNNLLMNLNDFYMYDNQDEMHQESKNAFSYEGQVVAIADEIAQRAHDIDDAFKANKIDYETFIKYSNLKKCSDLIKIDRDIHSIINQAETEKIILDKNDSYRSLLSKKIVDYFINDIVENCKTVKNQKLTGEKIIEFSEKGKNINSVLEHIISQKVINSAEVMKFDANAEKMVIKLFKYYYNNPKCLEDSTLERIYIEMNKFTENCIQFRKSDIVIMEKEINKIVNYDLRKNVIHEDGKKFTETKRLEYIMKRKIYARCISDFISGMTDTYAIDEYHKLYSF